MTASGRYLERERHDSIFTRTNWAFDANALGHDIPTPGFLRRTAAPHECGGGMWRLVCANSHVALVRVDPVEQSLRSHPFHGQTTLKQQRHKRSASVSRTILYRAGGKKTRRAVTSNCITWRIPATVQSALWAPQKKLFQKHLQTRGQFITLISWYEHEHRLVSLFAVSAELFWMSCTMNKQFVSFTSFTPVQISCAILQLFSTVWV